MRSRTASPPAPPPVTPSVAEIYDSGASESIANGTGLNSRLRTVARRVELANNSFAYADNAGSGADIIGTSYAPAITNDSNLVGDGSVFTESMSNLFQIDGIPDTTFALDLFGLEGAPAFTTAWTDLMALF